MPDDRIATDEWGIDDRYLDFQGGAHAISGPTRAALREAMGVGRGDGREGAYREAVVLRGARRWSAARAGDLRLEDGSSRGLGAGESVELPLGYHQHQPDDGGRPVRLIVCPARCYLPDDLRVWGWAAQLYAARSRQSWGMGDLGDLKTLARWSRRLGARVLMVNPLSAATPVPPIEASPYYPGSRRFRNPLYIRVGDVPGAGALGAELETLAAAGRALNQSRRIDRDAIFALKMQALQRCFDARFGSGDAGLRRYQAEQGSALRQFATHCAIAELHGKDWRRWPAGLRRPDAAGIAAFEAEHLRRISFHAWLQWLLDQQLESASVDVSLIQDLPIGLDIAGADAWCWQELLADGVSVGAPPDEYNPAGQDWGLTPFVPHRLRAAGYQPIIETLRATLRHAGGLRIDHVMGLFRLFWIPRGAGAAEGAFVRNPADDLLAIIALESQRARAFVVGEDLGTVEPGVREKMAEHRMLSYRLLYFEAQSPAEYPELALSTVSTHDLPTIAGLWSGADLTRSREAGAKQNEAGLRLLREKLASLIDVATTKTPAGVAEVPRVIAQIHAALAAAPSRVLLATLDDALAVEERPNTPGAAPDWPNWSLALPLPIEDLDQQQLPAEIARALARGHDAGDGDDAGAPPAAAPVPSP